MPEDEDSDISIRRSKRVHARIPEREESDGLVRRSKRVRYQTEHNGYGKISAV
jgi:hypothetical protein